MSQRPLLVAGHPRSCSTAFERAFLTQTETLECFHEPFGQPAWWGPERIEGKGLDDVQATHPSRDVTYRDVVEQIHGVAKRGKRAFVKDFPRYFLHPSFTGSPAPSFESSPSEPSHNPSLLPASVLQSFDWAVLVRSPRRTVPSYYRMCIPPANATTGMTRFPPENLGYRPLRRLLEFLISENIVAAKDITVLDADDMLDDPEGTLRWFCQRTNIPWPEDGRMLAWTDDDAARARVLFEPSRGWHDDALEAGGFRARVKSGGDKSAEEENEEWRERWGGDVQRMLRRAVDENMADYEWIRGLGKI